MRYEMTSPCAKCPFRTDVPGYLRRARAREIATTLTRYQQTFTCHATVDYETGEGEGVDTPDSQHCAGAMIMLEHMGQPNQMMRIAERLGMYDMRKLDMKAPVFTDDSEFTRHHNL